MADSDHRLRILHISDLHERAGRERDAWSRRRVLGNAWQRNLEAVVGDGIAVDILAFTGDIADWGLPEEYEACTEFIQHTLRTLGLSNEQVFPIPGNHDVCRTVENPCWNDVRDLASKNTAAQFSAWMADRGSLYGADDSWRKLILKRQTAFWDWVEHYLQRPELLPSNSAHGSLGYRASLQASRFAFPVHIVGFDSSWMCGANGEAGQIHVTEHQVGLLTTDASGSELPGFRLGLIHHPLHELRDKSACQALMGDHLDLLLRGHLHDPDVEQTVNPDRSLHQLAAGCLYEGSEGSAYPNSCQVIDVLFSSDGAPEEYRIHFRAWSPRGHWHADSSVYERAENGKLTWTVERPRESLRLPSTAVQHMVVPTKLLAEDAENEHVAEDARAVREDITARRELAREVRDLRNQAFDELTKLVTSHATPFAITVVGPLGPDNAACQEEASDAAARGLLHSRRISSTSADGLVWNIIFKGSEGYRKPWPVENRIGVLAYGRSSILLEDQVWVDEVVEIRISEETRKPEFWSADRNARLDDGWVRRCVDVLLGKTVPGTLAPLALHGTKPVSVLTDRYVSDAGDYESIGGKDRRINGSDCLRQWLRNELRTPRGSWWGDPEAGTSFSDVLNDGPLSAFRNLAHVVSNEIPSRLGSYIETIFRFDLVEPNWDTGVAFVEVELVPVGDSLKSWRIPVQVAPAEETTAPVSSPRPRDLTTIALAGFDEVELLNAYQARPHSDLVKLRGRTGLLPASLETGRFFSLDGTRPRNREAEKTVDIVKALSNATPGRWHLLVGPGGAGKTTTLHSVAAVLARKRLRDAAAPLPVSLNLARYSGDLDALVAAALSVDKQRWSEVAQSFALICDGLSEVDANLAITLAEDLQDRMQKGNITGVLATRPTGATVPLDVGEIGQVIWAEPLNYGDIRELAQRSLRGEQQAEFLRSIRSTRSTAPAEFYNLPFGIAALIRYFRIKGEVPQQLTQVLSVLTRERWRRNQRIAVRQLGEDAALSYESMCALAGAFAYELRAVRKRTAIASGFAREIVAQAVDNLSSDATITPTDGFNLLVLHEVIRDDTSGWVTFEHDVLSAYYAGRTFSQSWNEHRALLASRASDELWVLASPHVSQSDFPAFMECVLDRDEILAATCAREAGPEAQAWLSEELMRRGFPQSQVAYWRYSAALSACGGEASAYLAEQLKGERDEDKRHYLSVALARAGHRAFLEGVLRDADESYSGGMFMSGGAIAVWDAARSDLALQFARKRIDVLGPGEMVGLSARTIGAYGDVTDVERLVAIIDASASEVVRAASFFALATLSARDAAAFVETRRSQMSDAEAIWWMKLVQQVGGDVDGVWLLEYVVRSTDNDDADTSVNDACDILERTRFTPQMAKRVLRALRGSSNRLRRVLWRLAAAADIQAFEALALEAASSGDLESLLEAVQFSRSHQWRVEDESVLVRAVATALGKDNRLWLMHEAQLTLEYVFDRSKAEELAAELIRRTLRQYQLAGEDPGDRPVPDVWLFRPWLVQRLRDVLSVAARVASLTPDDRLGLLGVEFAFGFTDEQAQSMSVMLRDVEPDRIDTVLRGHQHRLARASALRSVASLQPTQGRRRQLLAALAAGITHPAIVDRLSAVCRMWFDEGLLAGIVDTVKAAELPDLFHSEIVARAFAWLPDAVSTQSMISVLQTAADDSTGGAERILRVWLELALHRRSGIPSPAS